jgi:hypothetical protein
VVVLFALEAEEFAAVALDSGGEWVVTLDAVVAIDTRAAFVALAGIGKEFTDLPDVLRVQFGVLEVVDD